MDLDGVPSDSPAKKVAEAMLVLNLPFLTLATLDGSGRRTSLPTRVLLFSSKMHMKRGHRYDAETPNSTLWREKLESIRLRNPAGSKHEVTCSWAML